MLTARLLIISTQKYVVSYRAYPYKNYFASPGGLGPNTINVTAARKFTTDLLNLNFTLFFCRFSLT